MQPKAAHSARLERVQVDPQGRLTPQPGTSLTVPLEGPATIECGAFVMVPHGRVGRRGWTVTEPGRPAWQWTVAGTDMVKGTSCLKLVGLQQTDDWEQPRGDRVSWRRRETVWLSPRDGVAHRLERIIERRLPLRNQPTQRSVLTYELAISPRLPRQLVDSYRRDIEQALRFLEAARPFLPRPAPFEKQLAALLGRIDNYLERQSGPTPYRAAVLQVAPVSRRRSGETPPALPPDTPESAPLPPPSLVEGVAVGQLAPNFVAPDFTHAGKSAELRGWRGRPVLLVFYSPGSRNLDELMELVGRLAAQHREAAVLGLAMTGGADRIGRQWREKRWAFPVLDGTGLCKSYGVTCTPKLVLIDARGVVSGMVVGWGSNTADEIAAELANWLKHKPSPRWRYRQTRTPPPRNVPPSPHRPLAAEGKEAIR